MGTTGTAKCSECGAMVRYWDSSMGVPGGKEREYAYCPNCNNVVGSIVTDGFVYVELINDEEQSSHTGSDTS
jgi:hypothetical protein